MNSADKRIEELLNRAGQTISDLPKEYKGDDVRVTVDLKYIDDEKNNLIDYILHLTDIIDRFEWALENVCGERDWLKSLARNDCCPSCVNNKGGYICTFEDIPDADENHVCLEYEYSGVPKDWSADDNRLL